MRKRIPLATYRLQFNQSFTFAQAAQIASYLRNLGISDCYASPVMQARPGSSHGYDVCRPDLLNPESGGTDGFRALSEQLHSLGMGLLLDIVPNHMAAHLANPWWADVLENGRESKFACWFDIDWESSHQNPRGQLLLPVLGDRYSSVLEAGQLRVVPAGPGFALAFHDHRFPINREGVEAILHGLGLHPQPSTISERLRVLNGTPSKPESFDDLDRIIACQHYRLAYWRVGPQEINYRRFFDIMELVSLRVELPEVFRATHECVFDLVKSGAITGLRVDHPDGLWNPREYFDRLQEQSPLYVTAEKILSKNEPLPEDWPVEGTTGYDFLNAVNGLYVDLANEAPFSKVYEAFTGITSDKFDTLVFDCKRFVLENSFNREAAALAERLEKLSAMTRYGRDFTFCELHRAVSDLVVGFPVYRTYVTAGTSEPSVADHEAIQRALQSALALKPNDEAVLGFVASLLQLQFPRDLDENARGLCRDFVMKFQQLTGPVMAKGLEDTAFYRFNRLLSLNEVGGDPKQFGIDIEEFHAQNVEHARTWPNRMLATATHDTKRGEDVRARLNVLSEIPEAWNTALHQWSEMNAGAKSPVGGLPAPDANDEYLIYQTLLGAWPPKAKEPGPDFANRIVNCVLKSLKEAKRHTSWIDPNPEYERAAEGFVRDILSRSRHNHFLGAFLKFLSPLAYHGFINSISQTLLKCASPGAPDFYQGSELWDLNLVDPDNRRPVDYQMRQRMLHDLSQSGSANPRELLAQLLKDWPSGKIKMFITHKMLTFRRRFRELFSEGAYIPLETTGKHARHLCAFARVSKDRVFIAAVPRFSHTLMKGMEKPPLGPEIWSDTAVLLPPSVRGTKSINVFSNSEIVLNEVLSAGSLFSDFIACFLVTTMEIDS